MKLKTWLRDWLGISSLAKCTSEQFTRAGNNEINMLTRINDLTRKQEKIDELLKMSIDFRLAQAANSLKLLTEFINEIQHDQNNEIHKANVSEQLRRRSDAH